MLRRGCSILGLALVSVLLAPTLVTAQDVNGAWTPWSVMSSQCSVSCGGGTNLRVRSCDNPPPSGAGTMCKKTNTQLSMIEFEQTDCNTQSCWDDTFSDWSNCSKTCGRGTMERSAMCGVEVCIGQQAKTEQKDCNTWNKVTCPSPCKDESFKCPEYGVCKDVSTDVDPVAMCVCTMGYTMNRDKTACIRPPPTTPTPRPIPTLPAEQKVVATVISKSASTLIIIFVSITLAIFFLLRIFTPDRVIQMNMEIALLLAHIMLMFPSSITETPTLCRVVSILVHYFFTACFLFMFLEALHMYSLVAFVVKKDGMFSRVQNTVVGWGVAAFIVLFCMCFEYDNYGGEYHCWLRVDTPLKYGQFIPTIMIVVMTLTLIEGAGAAEYKPLKGIDKAQLFSAKISQRTNLIIMPLVLAHWIVGIYSEYEQNLPLYGIFSILNGITGAVVFFFHCTNNTQVRAKLKGCYNSMCKSGGSR